MSEYTVEKVIKLLGVIKYCSQYERLEQNTPKEVLDEAWVEVGVDVQTRIIEIIENNVNPTPKAVAEELLLCKSKEELTALKTEFGSWLSKEAWQLLSNDQKVQIQEMCAPKNASSGGKETPELEESDGEDEVRTPEPAEAEVTAAKAPSSEREVTVELDPNVLLNILAVPAAKPKPADEVESVKSKSLIELSEEEEELQETIDNILADTEGRIPPNLAEAFDELLSRKAENDKQLKVKIDNYCAVMKHHYDWAEVRSKEAERLKELAERDVALAKVLEARLKNYLESSGKMKVKTNRFNPRICKNGGKQPLFLDVSAEDLPKEYKITKELISADSEALRKALEEGEELPFAHLGERGNHLRYI